MTNLSFFSTGGAPNDGDNFYDNQVDEAEVDDNGLADEDELKSQDEDDGEDLDENLDK